MITKIILSFLLLSISSLPINEKVAQSPIYEKGIMIDIARKYYSLSTLKTIVDEIKKNKGHYIQLHFSDDQNYAIASNYLKQTRTKTNSHYLTAAELKAFIKYSNDRSIMVIPDIDMPAHSTSWLTKVKPRLKKGERITTDFDAGIVDYFDNKSAVKHSKALLSEVMTQFKQSKYNGRQRIVIGGDEVAGAHQYQNQLIDYINQIARHSKQSGYKPQIWNDSLTSSGLNKLYKEVSILYWAQNGGKSSGSNVTVQDITNKGFNVYNYNSMSLYFIPSIKYSSASIKEQSRYIQKYYTPYTFHQNNRFYDAVTTTRSSGSALSFWGDSAKGMTQKQLLAQELPLIKVFLSSK